MLEFMRLITTAIVIAQASALHGDAEHMDIVTCAINKLDSDPDHIYDIELEGVKLAQGSQYIPRELSCLI